MSFAAQIATNNSKFVDSFSKEVVGALPLPPSQSVAIVACMDARLDVAAVGGIKLGEAHVIRNAGGRIDEGTIRSLVISQELLGTREIILIHHTDCGMLTFKSDHLHSLVKQRKDFDPSANAQIDSIAALEFSDVKQSVLDDKAYLEKHPLILNVPITGFIYHVENGKLEKVV